ncbi:cation-translocating P-type ATPase [Synechococcus sp. ATX 2A4]|uniref:heavy metal translocating P-type ATPase n=1 Tax=Synechococcus sp. ATX 2A4 TaxID=2823727 RepID=UPI0037DA4F99|nr:cation-translocating P-type ATPase [Synechococcus sp. ATX 2A4]
MPVVQVSPSPVATPLPVPPPPQALVPVLLEVDGMKCGGCVRAVEKRLLAVPGVHQASVNLLTHTAWVGLAAPVEAAQPSLDAQVAALLASLEGLGFAARLRDQSLPAPTAAELAQRHRWWLEWRQLIVALALLVVSVLGHLAEAGSLPAPLLASPLGGLLAALWFHALVATLALALPGRSILVRGALSAWHRMPSMDTLVGLGMGSAYLASLAALLWPAAGWPCFFNEPVMLLGFVLLGRFLEERARFRTGRALEQLAQLQPETALLLVGDGPPREVRVGGLRAADRLQLLPGDRVPVDGVVLEGCSAVDVSSLTGEPLPLEARPGSELAAGMLNLQAPLVLEVTRAGAATALARIIALVEQAQARKAPIQRLVDRVAGRFTVLVLVLALATFLFWWLWGTRLWPDLLTVAPQLGHGAAAAHALGGHGLHGPGHGLAGTAAETPFGLALQLAISVLVVACPCALGLATPTAITVGSGLAARAGVLFRGGDAIETAARLQAVLFDKTGTLTLGRPLVVAIALSPSDPAHQLAGEAVDADALIKVAASLEQQTRHPLAHALQQEAERRQLDLWPVGSCATFAGAGVEGDLEGVSGPCRVGRLDWLEQRGVGLDGPLRQRLSALEADGASVLAVAVGGRLLGLVAVHDQPRGDAAATVQELAAMGLSLGVLSGDRQPAVRRLGERLGLPDDALAWELRPEQKLDHIVRWRQQGPVAMVGDGINDAPALAAADLGIAVGTGTQIAQDTADLVILGDRLSSLVLALQLARRTLAKVRQNLFWAFGYNLVVLPIAAGALLPGFGVLLSPPLAALLMAMSSITVVVNALLLHGPA